MLGTELGDFYIHSVFENKTFDTGLTEYLVCQHVSGFGEEGWAKQFQQRSLSRFQVRIHGQVVARRVAAKATQSSPGDLDGAVRLVSPPSPLRKNTAVDSRWRAGVLCFNSHLWHIRSLVGPWVLSGESSEAALGVVRSGPRNDCKEATLLQSPILLPDRSQPTDSSCLVLPLLLGSQTLSGIAVVPWT